MILLNLVLLTLNHVTTGAKDDHQVARRYGMQPFPMSGPMAFPGLGSSSGAGMGSQQCITDDIVCPSWCLMEDEWGCKYCPCAPANGMSPPRVNSGSSRPEVTQRKEEDNCIGTILCMLSCKDGYKLGPKQETGCQSCSCTKNKTEDGSNANQDCIGPACSAKNGMRLMSELMESTPRPTSPTPTKRSTTTTSSTTSVQTTSGSPSCQETELCKQTCDGIIQLGPKKPDGCRECTCLTPVTEPPRTLMLIPLTPAPPARECEALSRCRATCRDGFEVDRSRDSGCPECRCLSKVTPPPPTEKPDFVSVMRVCPDAVHCMKTCAAGYTLTAPHERECPVCTCNKEPKVLLLCEKPLSCPNGCTVGYRCDEIGCPTCTCVAPEETTLRVQVQTVITQAALECNPHFSCVDKCQFGYKTGSNGCPTCLCLQPVTFLETRVETQEATPAPPYSVKTPPFPFIRVNPGVQSSCRGSECSQHHLNGAIPVPLVSSFKCSQPLLCPNGCSLGFKCDVKGCPTCTCIAPEETTYKVQVHSIIVTHALSCAETFTCRDRCAFGYKTGDDHCPSCTCLEPVAIESKPYVHTQEPHPAFENRPLVQVTQTPLVHQSFPASVTQMPLPEMVIPSGIGCLGPTCPSTHELSQQGNMFFTAVEHTQSGHQEPLSNVGSAVTLQQSHGGQTDVHTPVHQHPGGQTDANYGNGPGLTDLTLGIGHSVPSESGVLVIHKPGLLHSSQLVSTHSSSNSNENGPEATQAANVQSVMDACPDTVKCMSECVGEYKLTPLPGQTCPQCSCTQTAHSCIGPSCSAPSSHNQMTIESTPSPGQCVAILHCVMTCTGGYDVGEYGKDGCPSCTCID
ncbi:hypothetical protein DPMN_071614 [Dreissena polymorpha]|uniref:Antistasin-like domain-containing protein n=2 Tax=Dreissena polymorpha TaxID=45954 RepID=A0A9D3Z2N1_DREPO|nr:hypothetical protein DPMN_071614 [Dreissena polymorpha]